jgi:hypothetical protein
VDAKRYALARDLLAGDALDVNHVLETVDGCDLALTALVAASNDGDFVVLADGDAADLLKEMLDVIFGTLVGGIAGVCVSILSW